MCNEPAPEKPEQDDVAVLKRARKFGSKDMSLSSSLAYFSDAKRNKWELIFGGTRCNLDWYLGLNMCFSGSHPASLTWVPDTRITWLRKRKAVMHSARNFGKPFCSFNHWLLMSKMAFVVSGWIFRWVNSFFGNKTFSVRVANANYTAEFIRGLLRAVCYVSRT